LAGKSGFFEKHGLLRREMAAIPKWHVPGVRSPGSYVKRYQLKVIFSRIAKPQRKFFRCVCFCDGSGGERFITGVTNFVRQLQEITRLGHLFAQLFVLAS
jgi:hypothetical protein